MIQHMRKIIVCFLCICLACIYGVAYADEETAFLESSNGTIWFGESNGHVLHRDPFCRNRSIHVANPFIDNYEYKDSQAVWESGEWMICTACHFELSEQPAEAFPKDVDSIWDASLEEKAAILPGVWTLPSERSIASDNVLRVVQEYAKTNPELSRYLDAGVHQEIFVFHYDVAGPHEMEQRETYKALITTSQRETFGVILVDALSGDVYGARVVSYDVFESIYDKTAQ